jgi:hypothetical protein
MRARSSPALTSTTHVVCAWGVPEDSSTSYSASAGNRFESVDKAVKSCS